MKLVLIIFTLIINIQTYGQKNTGKFQNYFGSNLAINGDSTFKYTWRFDLMSSWTNGIWRISNDTIYLQAISVFDTLRYEDKERNIISDSLVFSLDEKSEIINLEEFSIYEIISGEQNRQLIPDKLYYEKGKLFEIMENDELITKKVKGIWTSKEYAPWYIRVEEK